MKCILITVLFTATFTYASALTINEVMSNPTGEDAGHEWVEIYNETENPVDVSTLTISIKGATAVAMAPLQGGTLLLPHGYAIIASIHSRDIPETRFFNDYNPYEGIVLKVASSMTLVNTSTSSIDLKLNGVTIASLLSYTPAAKEGTTLSYIDGNYVISIPTPGADNQVAEVAAPTANATTTETQITVPQMSPPTADIIIYMPSEKVVVAGAESEFTVFSQTRAGKPIHDLRYAWAFGDGGQGVGSSTRYRYVYNGRYIAQVEATNGAVAGYGRMTVRVVPPGLSISALGASRYGSYVEIRNPNTYDLDLSQWMLTIDGAAFPFPKNTLLSAGASTRFSGLAMGFASTTMATSTVVKILFPNLEEVTRYIPPSTETIVTPQFAKATTTPQRVAVRPQSKMVLGASTSTQPQPTSTATKKIASKDTRLVTWFRSLFSRK